uniref:ATP synthase F0 subunit 8 n=1 Tax=Panagrolaimus sp. JU765 TaxID=591449 RepID=A0AC34Q4C8_9BILA
MSNLVAIIRYWMQLPDMASGVFTMWYNFYLIALSIYWIKKISIVRKFSTKCSKVESKGFIDTFGDRIKFNQTMDEHIASLKAAWA